MESVAHQALRQVNDVLMGWMPLNLGLLMWRPGRILLRTPKGEVIEITARQLAPYDDDARELAAALAAIDAGDVE